MENFRLSTKDAIRETAIALFKEYGYENVTMKQICDACQITKRTFYYHYKSKQELLSGVIEYLGVVAEHHLESIILTESNVEKLWQVMSIYGKKSQEYGFNIMKQVYVLILLNCPEAQYPYDTHMYEIARDLIMNAQEKGEIMNLGDANALCYTLYHTLRSISYTWAAQDGKFDLLANYKKAFENILEVKVMI